jgi:hypothetical protein
MAYWRGSPCPQTCLSFPDNLPSPQLAYAYLEKTGNFVREEVLSAFIRLVAHTPELQTYSASKLHTALHLDISQEPLTLAAAWIIANAARSYLRVVWWTTIDPSR